MIGRGEVKDVASKARERKCNYIVYPNEVIDEKNNLENYGFKELAKNSSYTLYKDIEY